MCVHARAPGQMGVCVVYMQYVRVHVVAHVFCIWSCVCLLPELPPRPSTPPPTHFTRLRLRCFCSLAAWARTILDLSCKAQRGSARVCVSRPGQTLHHHLPLCWACVLQRTRRPGHLRNATASKTIPKQFTHLLARPIHAPAHAAACLRCAAAVGTLRSHSIQAGGEAAVRCHGAKGTVSASMQRWLGWRPIPLTHPPFRSNPAHTARV